MNEALELLNLLVVPAINIGAGLWFMVKSYKLVTDNDMIYRLLALLMRENKPAQPADSDG